MKEAVIFGAGNIGRGFLGQLFSESGYRLTFVDIDRSLLAVLNRGGGYPIRLVTNDSSTELVVKPVRGLAIEDQVAVVQSIAAAQLGATAVGARALEAVAPVVAAGVFRRAEQGITEPLNFIICENLKEAASFFRDKVKAALPPFYHPYLAQHVGFVEAVIARMVPPLPPETHAETPGLIVAEPYQELPVDAAGFVGPPPQIAGLIPAAPFGFYSERKLYIHNSGHAVLGYLGYQEGYTYGYEALLEPKIGVAVAGAMHESRLALERKYGLSPGALEGYVTDILARFTNRALGDTTFRLGRDPIRKLAYQDRLIGAARTALAYEVEPDYLMAGIVAALRFDPPEDPLALALQRQLREAGLASVLQSVCGLEPGSPLFEQIQQRFLLSA